MNKIEISDLFERINNHYNTFTRSEEKIEEWYRFLKDYDVKDVNRAFDEYLSYGYDNAPLVYSLTKNISKVKEVEDDDWITCCDLCKEKIVIHNNDMSNFDKHYRRCQKIDFIDRMSKRFRGQGVSMVKYYEMNDSKLDNAYNKIMAFYRQNRNVDAKILKEMPSEELY